MTVWDLMEEYTRRLNGTRVLVGEILGKEVGPGPGCVHVVDGGSACTIHARSARAVDPPVRAVRHGGQPAAAAGGGATGARQRPADHRAPGQGRRHRGRRAALLHVDLRGHRPGGRPGGDDRAVGPRRTRANSCPSTPCPACAAGSWPARAGHGPRTAGPTTCPTESSHDSHGRRAGVAGWRGCRRGAHHGLRLDDPAASVANRALHGCHGCWRPRRWWPSSPPWWACC